VTLPATHWTAGSRNGQCVTPNVHIYPVPTRAGVARFLAENKDESVQLAVVGGADAPRIAQIVGPRSHPLVTHGDNSVLIVH
jgi:hypothetical protein